MNVCPVKHSIEDHLLTIYQSLHKYRFLPGYQILEKTSNYNSSLWEMLISMCSGYMHRKIKFYFTLEGNRTVYGGGSLEWLSKEGIDNQSSSDWLLAMLTWTKSLHWNRLKPLEILKTLLGSLKLVSVKMDHHT